MSLFSAILRPAGRKDLPESAGTTLAPWHAFDAAIERSLRMLRGVHVPVSLFAIRITGMQRDEAATVIGEALSQFGPVGRLGDGSIGLLYLGPRSPNPDGDAALANHVFSRVDGRLQERGYGALCRSLELAAVHGWTDQIQGSADLIRALARNRAASRPPRESQSVAERTR